MAAWEPQPTNGFLFFEGIATDAPGPRMSHLCSHPQSCDISPHSWEEILHLTYFQLIQNDKKKSPQPLNFHRDPLTLGTWKIPAKCFIMTLPRIRFSCFLPFTLQPPQTLEKYKFSPLFPCFLALLFHQGYLTNPMKSLFHLELQKEAFFSP